MGPEIQKDARTEARYMALEVEFYFAAFLMEQDGRDEWTHSDVYEKVKSLRPAVKVGEAPNDTDLLSGLSYVAIGRLKRHNLVVERLVEGQPNGALYHTVPLQIFPNS